MVLVGSQLRTNNSESKGLQASLLRGIALSEYGSERIGSEYGRGGYPSTVVHKFGRRAEQAKANLGPQVGPRVAPRVDP